MRARDIRRVSKGSKLAIAAVAVAGAAAAIAALSLGSASSSHAAILVQAEQALSQNGIVHARFLAGNGSLTAEEWLNRETGETRRVEHNGPQGGDTITVQDGSRVISWSTINPAATTAVFEVQDPKDPWLEHASTLLRFKRMLEAGRAQISGETQVRGKPAWRVKVETPPGPDAASDLVVEILLDRQTLLPLAMTSTSGGRTDSVTVETEENPADSVPGSFFSSDQEPKIHDTRMRYEDLRTFTKFPVYTLGRAYIGLQVTAAVVEEQLSAPTDPFVFQPHLSVGYSNSGPYGDHVVDLTEQPAGTDQAKAELPTYEVPGIARQVTIDGKLRTAFLVKADDSTVALTAFAVELDGTLVSGRATMSPDDIVAMLARLQRVN